MTKELIYNHNHLGIFLDLNQFRGSPIECRIFCRNCKIARNAYHPKYLKVLGLIPPQDIPIHSFCAACGWMYQKVPIPKGIKIRVNALDLNECVYCGVKKEPGRKFGLDHLTPEVEGGRNTVKNLVLCCQTCNSEKGRKTNWYKPKFGRFRK